MSSDSIQFISIQNNYMKLKLFTNLQSSDDCLLGSLGNQSL